HGGGAGTVVVVVLDVVVVAASSPPPPPPTPARRRMPATASTSTVSATARRTRYTCGDSRRGRGARVTLAPERVRTRALETPSRPSQDRLVAPQRSPGLRERPVPAGSRRAVSGTGPGTAGGRQEIAGGGAKPTGQGGRAAVSRPSGDRAA